MKADEARDPAPAPAMDGEGETSKRAEDPDRELRLAAFGRFVLDGVRPGQLVLNAGVRGHAEPLHTEAWQQPPLQPWQP